MLRRGNYLQKIGWFRSCDVGYAVDQHGEALPWYSYPAIAFLERRLSRTMKVFEFGAGQSTLWYARRVEQVIACEHNRSWYDHVANTMPGNVTMLFEKFEPGSDYSKSVNRYGPIFDLISIDGEDRSNCAKNAVATLNEAGVILFDNTEHPANHDGMKFLTEHGFRQIEFEGMAPAVPWKTWTSIFYRPGNCLGI